MIPNLIVNLLFLGFGTLGPGYQTFLKFTRDGVKDCKGWIKYWIVYAVLTGFWSITDILFFWLPFYEMLKLGLMVWLFLAPLSCSEVLFDYLIFPLMVQNEQTLEIAMNVSKGLMCGCLGNVMREVYDCMGRFILPYVINIIRDQLYPVLISEMHSVLLKSHGNEMNSTARVVEIESETEIEARVFDEWEEALITQLPEETQSPEEDNDEVTHIEQNPFLNESDSINENANRYIENSNNKHNNNFVPTEGNLDICEIIQLTKSKTEIKDVKVEDEAIYEKIGQSTMH